MQQLWDFDPGKKAQRWVLESRAKVNTSPLREGPSGKEKKKRMWTVETSPVTKVGGGTTGRGRGRRGRFSRKVFPKGRGSWGGVKSSKTIGFEHKYGMQGLGRGKWSPGGSIDGHRYLTKTMGAKVGLVTAETRGEMKR